MTMCYTIRMVHITLTRHLFAFFPHLADQALAVQATNVREAVAALDGLAPGIGYYVCDERGRLRPHVNAFVNNDLIRDRRGLTDPLAPGDHLHILQALSGG